MKNINKLIIGFMVYLLGCTSENKNLSDVDTTQILDKTFNSVQINESLTDYFSNQPLRIVRNSFLKNDYKFIKNGMAVVYVDIDSSSTKLSDWRKPKLYANIIDFKMVSKEKVSISLRFRASGRLFELVLVKKNDEWIVSKFKDSDI